MLIYREGSSSLLAFEHSLFMIQLSKCVISLGMSMDTMSIISVGISICGREQMTCHLAVGISILGIQVGSSKVGWG
jgi:hypothetical protein